MSKREDFSQEVEERELYDGDEMLKPVIAGLFICSAFLAFIALVFSCI